MSDKTGIIDCIDLIEYGVYEDESGKLTRIHDARRGKFAPYVELTSVGRQRYSVAVQQPYMWHKNYLGEREDSAPYLALKAVWDDCQPELKALKPQSSSLVGPGLNCGLFKVTRSIAVRAFADAADALRNALLDFIRENDIKYEGRRKSASFQ